MDVWTFWLILAAVFLIIELFTQSLTCLYLGLGALCAMLCSLAGAGWSVTISVLIISTLAIFLSTMRLRTRLLSYLHREAKNSSTGMEALIGRKGKIEISDRPRIKIDGDTWLIRPSNPDTPLQHGKEAIVISYDSTILEVDILN